MIILKKATSDKLTLTRSTAATLDVVSWFVDALTASATAPAPRSPENEAHAFSSAATGDMVASPANTLEVRGIKNINIMNKDAALSCVVTVNASLNGTTYALWTETLMPGDCLQWLEGVGFVKLTSAQNLLFKCLSSDDTGGANSSSAQPWFPTAGGLTVPGASSFWMDGILKLSTGATTHTTAIAFGGTATLTDIQGYATVHRAAADTISSTFSGIPFTSASAAVADVTGTQVATLMRVQGFVRFNAAGTFIPQFKFSADPTGTITAKKGTYFRLTPFGDNTTVSAGSWA